MKKLLILLTLIASIFVLASCNLGGDTPEKEENTCKHGDEAGDWFIKSGAVEATCLEDGLTNKVYCSECGFVKTEQEVVPATGHKTSVLPAENATCLKDGITAGVVCDACGEVLCAQLVIPKKNHSVVDTPSKAPTCIIAGSEGGTHCSICLTVIEEPEIIPPYGHDREHEHIEVIEGYAPTTEAEGLTDSLYCTICETEVLSAKPIPKVEE